MRRLFAAALAALAPAGLAAEPYQDRLLREHLFRQVRELPKGERPVVGLALSAGGMRGIAHAGVIRVLEAAAFPIDVLAGTSAGAVVGALYAGGVPTSRFWEVPDYFRLTTATDLDTVGLLRLILQDRLASSERMDRFIRSQIGDRRFEDLRLPFACVAMDIRTGEAIVFREGELAPAVRASMNLPGVFSPVVYRHRHLVDGGVVDYIPIDVARLLGAEWVAASVTEPDFTQSAPKNVLQSLEQVIDIRGAVLARTQRRDADALIDPPVGDINFYETWRAVEALEKGVRAARLALPRMQEGLILYAIPRLARRWSPGSAP